VTRLVLSIAAITVALAWPRFSHAQDQAGLARAAFERGVSAADEGRYADAAVAFEASYRARAVPVVLHNLGLAYRAMGRNRAAIDAFERYLGAPAADATQADLSVVRDAVRTLRAALVTVAVSTTPPDASVTVDGRPEAVQNGTLTLDPGTHAFDIRADGYAPARRELRLSNGARARLDVTLTAMDSGGRLLVEPSVAAARVSIDGNAVGTGHVETVVAPGEHTVEIRATGYELFRRTVNVGARGLVRVDANLSRVATAGGRGGNAAVWAVPLTVGGSLLVAGAVILGVVLGGGRMQPPTGTWGEPIPAPAM